MSDISTPLLNEVGQWAEKELVRSEGQTFTCVLIYICVPFPPCWSDCISLISVGNQAEKRSGGKSDKILFSSSEATAKSACPTVWRTVHSPGYSAAGRLLLF